tara:strand:+ start:34536 stop:34709 length:174 start_codon:yes stop_codon:yes gene_type:complete
MRAAVHNTPIQFRANSAIVDAAYQKARHEGMSLSELIRSALRREVSEYLNCQTGGCA